MKDTISYDPDFLKLDLRVGLIQSIELIPKSKKLIKMQVDFGAEVGVRTIAAGLLKDYTDGRVAVGQKVLAVINLEPRDMMGVMSHGMLLAAHDAEGKVWPITAVSEIVPGTEVG